MINCPRCTATNAATSRFCNYCGLQLPQERAVLSKTEKDVSTKFAKNAWHSFRRQSIGTQGVIVLAGIFMLLTVATMMAYIQNAGKQNKQDKSTTSIETVASSTNSVKPATLIQTPTGTPANTSNNSTSPVISVTPTPKIKKNNDKIQKTSEEISSLLAEDSPDETDQTAINDSGYHLGSRGGCYYFGGTGRKVYVDRSLCGSSVSKKSSSSSSSSSSSNGYIRGPRGGCYYITAGGNKKYVDRSLCD